MFNVQVPSTAGRTDVLEGLVVAQSAAMREVCRMVGKVAPSNAPVLIRGESGTGKELVAQAVHRRSRRADGRFVHVNCGGVREVELEARLFGEQERAFPPGEQTCQGLLQQANGGTIFQADVDRLPLWAQVQLFDAFQEGCLHCCEGIRPVPLDVRVIASTACDLEAVVAEGRFHSGLYYLLSVVTIHVPPLRERLQDIKTLVNRCLVQTLAGQGIAADGSQCHFTPGAWQRLLGHDWPGNLPELTSVVTRAVAMADGKEIGTEAIAWAQRMVPCHDPEMISVPLLGTLQEIERRIIEEVLERCRGNKAAAARALGLHRRTLYRMLEEDAGSSPATS